MENPHVGNQRQSETGIEFAKRMGMAVAYADGHHSRDKVVEELVEAGKGAEFVLRGSTGSVGRNAADELRTAIARAAREVQ